MWLCDKDVFDHGVKGDRSEKRCSKRQLKCIAAVSSCDVCIIVYTSWWLVIIALQWWDNIQIHLLCNTSSCFHWSNIAPQDLPSNVSIYFYLSTCQWRYMRFASWVCGNLCVWERFHMWVSSHRRKPQRANNNVAKLLNMAWNDFIAILH